MNFEQDPCCVGDISFPLTPLLSHNSPSLPGSCPGKGNTVFWFSVLNPLCYWPWVDRDELQKDFIFFRCKIKDVQDREPPLGGCGSRTRGTRPIKRRRTFVGVLSSFSWPKFRLPTPRKRSISDLCYRLFLTLVTRFGRVRRLCRVDEKRGKEPKSQVSRRGRVTQRWNK